MCVCRSVSICSNSYVGVHSEAPALQTASRANTRATPCSRGKTKPEPHNIEERKRCGVVRGRGGRLRYVSLSRETFHFSEIELPATLALSTIGWAFCAIELPATLAFADRSAAVVSTPAFECIVVNRKVRRKYQTQHHTNKTSSTRKDLLRETELRRGLVRTGHAHVLSINLLCLLRHADNRLSVNPTRSYS